MTNARREDGPGRALALLHRAEDFFLVLLLLAMIALAPLQIILRNFFDSGIAWADPLLRALVLWLGLFGAVAASRGDRHITIDVASRFLSPRRKALFALVTSLFTSGISGLIAWHSGRFVYNEWEFGSTAFSGLPAWLFELAIPLAFALIAIRYALACLTQWSLFNAASVAPDSSESSADSGVAQ